MPLSFEVTLHRYGVIRLKATVPATEARLVGDYYDGKPYQPDTDAVRMALPYAYRKAFDRALKWWQSEYMSGRSMPLRAYLYSARGHHPLGTLFATPLWDAIGGKEV